MILLCHSLAGFAGSPTGRVDEFLNERTGATLTVVRQPLTFALERSTLAAHARDYVSMTAVEVDRSGETQLYVIAYFWSTIDRRKSSASFGAGEKIIRLFADGRTLRLKPLSDFPLDLDSSAHLLAPQTAHFQQAAYRVPADWLDYVASSRVVVLRMESDADDEDSDGEADSYQIWTDGRRSLKDFIERIAPAG